MEKLRNIYDEFAVQYIHKFMEYITEGVQGGLYNETIEVFENEEGIFKKEDIQRFIRFQHGDNDYHDYYSNLDDERLQKHIDEVAKYMLKYIEFEDSWDKKHYEDIFPHLIENTKNSLNKIIDEK